MEFSKDFVFIFLCFLFSFLTHPARGHIVSTNLALEVCDQREEFFESKVLQSPIKFRPKHLPEKCGWFDISEGAVNFGHCSEFPTPDAENLTLLEEDLQARFQRRLGNESRIVGGEEAVPHEFPSIVMMLRVWPDKKGITCGGTIVDKKWVVTAAHCLRGLNASTYEVLAGKHTRAFGEETEQGRAVEQVIPHPDFNKDFIFEFDIGLLKLVKPFKFNKNVRKALLPKAKYRAQGRFSAVGWGLLCDRQVNETCTVPETLQKVTLPFVPDDQCREQLDPGGNVTQFKMPESNICAGYEEGGKDGCQGDSGGPLYKKNKNGAQILVGVTSWGDGCAQPGKPGVWTEVAYYKKWIKKTIEMNS